MDIAFLTTEYITEKEFDGGLANYLYRVAQVLRLRGHYVEIFTLSEDDSEVYHQGILVHRVANKGFSLELLNRLTRYKFKRTLRFLSLSYCLNKRLHKREEARRQQFDIVQASSCFACGLFSTLNRHRPLVTRVSSFEPLFRKFYRRQLNLDQRLCEWLELLVLIRSHAVYTPSRLLLKVLEGQDKLQVDVLRPPFFLELKNNHFDRSIYERYLFGKRYLLFFGAIGFLKGAEILAQILPKFLSKYPEIYFVFVGKVLEGPEGLTMMDYIMQKARTFKERIVYLGILAHPQLYPIIKGADAVVLPSLIDNFPNTMLESMALGKIVIGTKGTSFEEFIEQGLTGILAEPNSAQALLEAMETVCNMPEEPRNRISDLAQKEIGRLSPEITCAKLEGYFDQVLKKRPKK